MIRQLAVSTRPGSFLNWKGRRLRVTGNDTLAQILTLEDGTRLRYKPGTEIVLVSRPYTKRRAEPD